LTENQGGLPGRKHRNGNKTRRERQKRRENDVLERSPWHPDLSQLRAHSRVCGLARTVDSGFQGNGTGRRVHIERPHDGETHTLWARPPISAKCCPHRVALVFRIPLDKGGRDYSYLAIDWLAGSHISFDPSTLAPKSDLGRGREIIMIHIARADSATKTRALPIRRAGRIVGYWRLHDDKRDPQNRLVRYYSYQKGKGGPMECTCSDIPSTEEC